MCNLLTKGRDGILISLRCPEIRSVLNFAQIASWTKFSQF